MYLVLGLRDLLLADVMMSKLKQKETNKNNTESTGANLEKTKKIILCSHN